MRMAEVTGVDFLCFGGEDWWYHNRGHIDMQLMRRFARNGTTLYVNSIVMQKPSFKRSAKGGETLRRKLVRKTKSIFRGLRKTEAGFWVYSPLSLPVHHVRWLRPVNKLILSAQLWLVRRKLGLQNPVVWVACPAACEVALAIKNKSKLVYQRTDRFEEFPNVDFDVIRGYDGQLKKVADLTIYVSRQLYESESGQCRKAMYLDHGVDYEMFSSAEKADTMPADLSGVPRPIIGFFGGFGQHTTDTELVRRLVELIPDKSFVFIGHVSPECDSFRERKNVWMLGQKPYEQIPHYGKYFDVAIMPWKQNRWIEACNPIKLKEYLALGKPVVSTPFNELKKYLDVVYEAKTAEDFALAIEKALSEDGPDRIAARRRKVERASWDSKAQLVLDGLFE